MDWFSRGLPALTRALLTSQSNSDHWFLWRKVWGEGTKREKKRWRGGGTLSEQSRRLPTWSERNRVSDLHISSVRHALSRDLLHLSLTRKCVCIPNGWQRGWATARSDSEGSIRQVWLFLSSLSVWGAAAPVVRWVTQQSAVGSKCCSTAILWLVELEKVFCFFCFFRKLSQYSSNHVFLLCASVCTLHMHLILRLPIRDLRDSNYTRTHAHAHTYIHILQCPYSTYVNLTVQLAVC